ncbi:MAG TPA: hypothetical protein VFA90_09090 [Terriglobales bacterium]|nr:hypothetical protein [Terriglobales bacterium]
MMRAVNLAVLVMLLSLSLIAASKPHVVTLGRWAAIPWRPDSDESKPSTLKMRPLYIDGHTKEFTVGAVHDVTERTFVVQRVYRLNDSLPQENGPTQWRWQLGGWLLVDRSSGKVQQVALSEFDPNMSSVSWFRDYGAYCGISDDGQKIYALIVQLGRRKPLLRKAVGENKGASHPCSPPVWERNPIRATFGITPDQKLTFAVKSRAAEAIVEGDDDSDSE